MPGAFAEYLLLSHFFSRFEVLMFEEESWLSFSISDKNKMFLII